MTKLLSTDLVQSVTFVRNLMVVGLCVLFLTSTLSAWLENWLEPTFVHQLTWEAMGERPNPSKPKTSETPPNMDLILAHNIFGGAPREPIEKDDAIALETIPLAKNLQNYSLVGTIVNDLGVNYAIIKDTRQREQLLLQEGDTLESTRITRILRNNVIIQKDNQEQMLSIDYSARNLVQSNVDSEDESQKKNSKDTIYVDISKKFINDSISNLESVINQARITPYMHEGRRSGYLLKNIQPGSIFDKLGLKSGDVVINMDGTRIQSHSQLITFFNNLNNLNETSLHVLRNGNDFNIKYSLN